VTVHGSKRKADFELQKLLTEAQQSRARDSSVLVSQNLPPPTDQGSHGSNF